MTFRLASRPSRVARALGVAFALATLALPTFARAQASPNPHPINPNAPIDGVARVAHVAYGTTIEQRVDLYYPTRGNGPYPVVVFVHGGWLAGNGRAAAAVVAKGLAPAGYVVASVDYRKTPAVRLQDSVGDVASALEYVVANSRRLQLDSNAIAILAHSSGSQMVALVASDPAYAAQAGLDLAHVSAIVTLDGVFDVVSAMPQAGSNATRRRELDVFGDDRNVWSAMSPVSELDRAHANAMYCVIHDGKFPFYHKQADEFTAALQHHGATVTEIDEPDLNTADLLANFDDPKNPVPQAVTKCLTNAVATTQ